MPRKHVYRVGDTIRIVQPLFVERVGYPKVWTSYFEKYKTHPKLIEAMELLDLPNPGGRAQREFAEGAARAANRLAGFGGRERAIHHFTYDGYDYRGEVCEVLAKRVVRTGTYYPPSGGKTWTDYGYEYDYENGGLDDAKSHVLLCTRFGEIEACNVEPAE